MKAHRPAALAACAAAAAAAMLTAAPASAAPGPPAPVICTWQVEHTSSTNIRDGLALRTGPSDSDPLVKPRLPSRMLNGTQVTGNARAGILNKREHIVWIPVTITRLVPRDPTGDRNLHGWAASSNGHRTTYLHQLRCTTGG